MSDIEDRFKLEMRLSAVEYLAARTHVMVMMLALKNRDAVAKALDDHAAQAPSMLFQGLDPAWSDAASAEWGDAVKRLVDIQKEILAWGRTLGP